MKRFRRNRFVLLIDDSNLGRVVSFLGTVHSAEIIGIRTSKACTFNRSCGSTHYSGSFQKVALQL